MRIISWNVNANNKKIDGLVDHVLSLSPDIVCFQEFPQKKIPLLSQLTNYTFNTCYDMQSNISDEKSMLIVTLIRNQHAITSHQCFSYFDSSYDSIWKTVVYQHINKLTEQDICTITELSRIAVINTRLSAATSPSNRNVMLHNILKKAKEIQKPTIICGDLNTSANLLFNMITSPIRGYSLNEISVDEGRNVRHYLEQFNYTNPFQGQGTMSYRLLPKMQLDYILIPKTLTHSDPLLGKDNFSSDHKMLQLDITP